MPAGQGRRYAHSLQNKPKTDWELLINHLQCVGARSAGHAAVFGWENVARAAGLLHDIGKCSAAFQDYICAERTVSKKVNHSTAGALEACRLYGTKLGHLLAFVIAGHHAGLADGKDLESRLAQEPPAYDGWHHETGPLPSFAAFKSTRIPKPGGDRGFSEAFVIRMLFSCLVDADRLETASFYAKAGEGAADRVEGTSLVVLRDRLAAFMAGMAANAEAATAAAGAGAERARLAGLRKDILDRAVAKAGLKPGFFTMTVPTGGGKTLASLSFALEHAVAHDLRRIVYVIPFTSIIEQTAAVFREALGPAPSVPNDDDILEHHATFDWEAKVQQRRDLGEAGRGTDSLERLQRATENWDAPRSSSERAGPGG